MGLRNILFHIDFINDDVELTYPVGGEGFVPFEYEAIRWDAIDNNMTFTLEYSLNNGATWNTIIKYLSSQTFYPWYVPNSVTSQAKIRISRGNSVSESTNNFSIISVPTNLSVYWPCQIQLMLVGHQLVEQHLMKSVC